MRPAPLVKQECSKHMDIEEQAPVKTLIIHFHFIFGQISMARRLFKILYISSTITTVTIHFISINFAVLWNARFFNIFYKIHWSNVFFVFYTFFLKIKIYIFCFVSLFASILQMTNLLFAFKNKNCCYLIRVRKRPFHFCPIFNNMETQK